MSHWAKLSLNVAADPNLKPSAKVVYALLVYHCNDGDSCYPGMRTLMRECGLSDKTVQACIVELEKAGYITVNREKMEGKNARNIYTIKSESAVKTTTLLVDDNIPKAQEKLLQGVVKTTTQAQYKLLQKETDQRKRQGARTDSKKAKPSKPKRFTKPTTEQVREYAGQINFAELMHQPGKFIDFYESKGWKVGSSPMKCWKAAIRTWKGKRADDNPAKQAPPDRPREPSELEKKIAANQAAIQRQGLPKGKIR